MNARRLSLLKVLAVLCALVLALVETDTQLVYADAVKCSGSNLLKANCLRVHSHGGSGPDIDYIKASRGASTLDPRVCNVQFVYIITRRATLLAHGKSPVLGGCGINRGWTFQIDRTFPAGSKICIYVFEEGKETGGQPCATIS